MIEILYFARLRERLGRARERIALPTGVATAGDLVAHLRGRGDPWAASLGAGEMVLIAVNQEMARPETPVKDGDEVALFPPVTGG
ncbi:MAG: molybdopterin converting factor subunit 1 [Chromatiaceae bacterium]|jgi:molybdopterin synthase sulfur carrier subunit